jgi:NO-binding membrane sensor protein with MHYT domain
MIRMLSMREQLLKNKLADALLKILVSAIALAIGIWKTHALMSLIPSLGLRYDHIIVLGLILIWGLYVCVYLAIVLKRSKD